MSKFITLCLRWPKTACLIAGAFAALAMPPYDCWPALMAALCAAVLIFARLEKPLTGAWCGFAFAMGYFTLGLWWVANAFRVDLHDLWWAVPFAVLGLPLLLSVLWFAAGYAAVRFSKPDTLARGVLFLSLLALAEFGRAFNFSGFPWNLFAYTWSTNPLAQLNALGGVYFVNTMTLFWLCAPALAYLAGPHMRARNILTAVLLGSLTLSCVYGVVRLRHPAAMRQDTGIVIVQPNISAGDKWQQDKILENFARHIDISKRGLDAVGKPPAGLKSIVIVWPETSMDEQLVTHVPAAPKALLDLIAAYPYKIEIVSGLMREENGYYNSIAAISSTPDKKLNLDSVYDKHHLVPFGEFIPFEDTLHVTPLVGFAGFKQGPGPRLLRADIMPPAAPLVCYESIFPWYARVTGAEWIVNVSNDGWYGDTPGPYQNLAMTQARAIEQGMPVIRSATTGISAVIDSYGRIIQSLKYGRQGFLVSALPQMIYGGTLYAHIKETLFFLSLALGLALSAVLRRKEI